MISQMRLNIRTREANAYTAILLVLLVVIMLGTNSCAGITSASRTAPTGPAALAITTTSLSNGTAQVSYSASLSATGGTPPYGWSVSSGQLPPGLSLGATSGTIAGTPTQSGSYSFSITVSDSASPPQTATAPLSITVSAAGSSLSISTSSLPSGQQGSGYSTTLSASGGTTPYSWSVTSGSLPAGLTLGSSSGQITGTPTGSGTSSFTVQVKDSSSPAQTASKTLSITIAASVSTLQITTSSLASGQQGTAYSATLLATGGTTPYSWSVTSGSLPAGLTLGSSSGQIAGTPTGSGTSSFTVQVQDSSSPVQTASKTFSITIATSASTLQVATSSLASGQQGTAYSATLSASGGTTPYSWSITSGSLPAGLTLGSSSGQITGTPTGSGTSSFTVQVKDSSSPAQTASKSLSITISTAVSTLQIITSTLPDGQQGTTYSATLSATGGKTPYTWSITSGSLPTGLSLSASLGQITGTPTGSGTSSFTVQVQDSSSPAASALQVLSIFVNVPGAGTPITSCQSLSSSGTTYVLQNDVSASGTCFSISADNVTLNLNGHTVTYGTSSQSSPVHGVGGSSSNAVIYGGTITQGSGTLSMGSDCVNISTSSGSFTGPTVHDLTLTWSAPESQGISVSYDEGSVAGGAIIYNNTLYDNSSYICSEVACRDALQGASLLVMSANYSTTPSQIYNNTISGGPQGGIGCDSPGCVIYGNNINPGNSAISYSNDFAIWCWSSCNAYNNTIMTPLTTSSQARGIQLSGTECEALSRPGCAGRNVHNNTIGVIEHCNNAEYGSPQGTPNGCELGGAYGIQFDDTPANATAQNNTIVAWSSDAIGTGLRVTDSETLTNVSQNNSYTARLVSSPGSSDPCTYPQDNGNSTCAFGAAFDGPTPNGITIQSDTFTADTADIFIGATGAPDETFLSSTFNKGTYNPINNWHLLVARPYSSGTNIIRLRDSVFGSGVSTAVNMFDIPAQGNYGNGSCCMVSVYIDWTQTVTVNKSSGGAAASATVTFTDSLGNTYSGSTNSSGVATVVVTQERHHNDSSANQLETRTPFSRTVSLSGCTTSSTTGLQITGTGSATVTLSGC